MSTMTKHARSSRLLASLALLLIGAVWLGGCRESRSEDPPVHLNPNMDNQAYVEGQEPVEISVDGHVLFEHGGGMRPYPEGTVAADDDALRADDAYYTGKLNGSYVSALPRQLELDEQLVRRGQQRYEIYCVPCHDRTGGGNGLVVQRGMTPPPSYYDDQRLGYEIGKLFEIISIGGDAMPSYASQVPVADRWAIATYVRSLQYSHRKQLGDLPEAEQQRVRRMLSSQRLGQLSGLDIAGQVEAAVSEILPMLPAPPEEQQPAPGGSNQ